MLVVVNPLSGAEGDAQIAWLKQQLKQQQITATWFNTTGNFVSDRDAIVKATTTGTTVVVIGGDGTLHLVANAIARRNNPLALLPAGTGNDFARQFNYSKAQWRAAVFSDQVTNIDLGKVDSRWFVNVAGVGFNAHVMNNLGQKKRLGKLSYTYAGLISLFSAKSICYHSKTWPEHGMMLLLANGKHFGAGLTPAPMASLNDGQLELLWFTPKTHWQRVVVFASMLLKRHIGAKNVHHDRITELCIAQAGYDIEADGEIVGCTPATITCCRQALSIKKAPS
ncbi:diacylglycerol/lipid kinase family protein [Pseudoalteromonas peptidolytica]|uniref:diacylglycerol/lipid kinase family protein n=1 Tax=Pseudoalteromonas peptidolytica TaxID=61150 RepID=UPI00298E563B|nr:YegS/Rv2252/BmrU family lipid kinase [Pseudoalteromonas peptidolytica]MDW7551069.1 YegS/Rv2252/BmrU family lipid kinase [Pseudoalteromonas peptidolytica]